MAWHRTLLPLITAALWFAGTAQADCPAGAEPATPPQRAAAARQDRGPLWRLERDGRTSWLYGTLHLGKPAWMTPGPAVRAALAASDAVALEIDPADPSIASTLGPEPGAPELPAALRDRLARAAAAICLPEGALATLHPGMQAVLLGVLEARWVGLDPGYAQEQLLAQWARDGQRPLFALETVALQKEALVPDSPQALHAMIAGTLDQLESGRGRAVILRLARAWEEGDLATLESYERWCDCANTEEDRAGLRSLNDERNPGLAARIDELHRGGRRVFAAVGALHMTGAQALPRLLAERGFRVERVAPQR